MNKKGDKYHVKWIESRFLTIEAKVFVAALSLRQFGKSSFLYECEDLQQKRYN